MSLSEIEQAIASLPQEELSECSSWFEDYLAEQQWEENFEADVLAGKLDHLARKADEDVENGLCKAL